MFVKSAVRNVWESVCRICICLDIGLKGLKSVKLSNMSDNNLVETSKDIALLSC